MARESNAARLAGATKSQIYCGDGDRRLRDLLLSLAGYEESDRIERCQEILDILASWRTCGSCKFWEKLGHGTFCTNLGLDPEDRAIHPKPDWTCGAFEEERDD